MLSLSNTDLTFVLLLASIVVTLSIGKHIIDIVYWIYSYVKERKRSKQEITDYLNMTEDDKFQRMKDLTSDINRIKDERAVIARDIQCQRSIRKSVMKPFKTVY